MARKVIVGLDDSDGGHRALFWALRHTQDTGAELEVVTAYQREAAPWAWVAGPADERGWAEHHQASTVKRIRAGFDHPAPVRCRVVEGPAVVVLCAAAADADLLVLGSHGLGRVATTLLGSTTAACVRHSTAPVLIVPAHDRVVRTAEATPVGASTEPM